MLNVILIVKENCIWHLNGSFYCLFERFIAYGIVKEKKRTQKKQLLMTKIQTCLLLFNWILLSTRQLKRECIGGQYWELHENKFHPHHIHLHQNLEEPDFVSHNFCNIMLRMINKIRTFLSSYFPIKLISIIMDKWIGTTCISGRWRILFGCKLLLFNALGLWMSGVTSWTIILKIFKWQSIHRFSRKHTPKTIRKCTRFTYKHVDAIRWSTSSFCKDFLT